MLTTRRFQIYVLSNRTMPFLPWNHQYWDHSTSDISRFGHTFELDHALIFHPSPNLANLLLLLVIIRRWDFCKSKVKDQKGKIGAELKIPKGNLTQLQLSMKTLPIHCSEAPDEHCKNHKHFDGSQCCRNNWQSKDPSSSPNSATD